MSTCFVPVEGAKSKALSPGGEFMEPIKVACYSGYKGEERPVAFVWRGKRIQIVEIRNRWYEQGIEAGRGTRSFFQVRAPDNRVYLIFQDQLSGEWFLETDSGVSASGSGCSSKSSSPSNRISSLLA